MSTLYIYRICVLYTACDIGHYDRTRTISIDSYCIDKHPNIPVRKLSQGCIMCALLLLSDTMNGLLSPLVSLNSWKCEMVKRCEGSVDQIHLDCCDANKRNNWSSWLSSIAIQFKFSNHCRASKCMCFVLCGIKWFACFGANVFFSFSMFIVQCASVCRFFFFSFWAEYSIVNGAVRIKLSSGMATHAYTQTGKWMKFHGNKLSYPHEMLHSCLHCSNGFSSPFLLFIFVRRSVS